MGYLAERVSYLKGLADGMELGDDTKEAKLLKAVIDLLDDIAVSVEDLEAGQEELQDFVNDLDSDLGDVEEFLCDECDCDCDCDCDCEEEELEFDEIECPSCEAVIELDDAILSEDCTTITCPVCGEEFEVDWDDCDCDCDCGCGCDCDED